MCWLYIIFLWLMTTQSQEIKQLRNTKMLHHSRPVKLFIRLVVVCICWVMLITACNWFCACFPWSLECILMFPLLTTYFFKPFVSCCLLCSLYLLFMLLNSLFNLSAWILKLNKANSIGLQQNFRCNMLWTNVTSILWLFCLTMLALPSKIKF